MPFQYSLDEGQLHGSHHSCPEEENGGQKEKSMLFRYSLHEGQLHGSQELAKKPEVLWKTCLKHGQKQGNKTSYPLLGNSGK